MLTYSINLRDYQAAKYRTSKERVGWSGYWFYPKEIRTTFDMPVFSGSCQLKGGGTADFETRLARRQTDSFIVVKTRGTDGGSRSIQKKTDFEHEIHHIMTIKNPPKKELPKSESRPHNQRTSAKIVGSVVELKFDQQARVDANTWIALLEWAHKRLYEDHR